MQAPFHVSCKADPGFPTARVLRSFGVAILLLTAAALHGVVAGEEFLEPQKAFRFSARPLDAKSVEVSFQIAPNYYLYREQFKFAASGATLGLPVVPRGKVKFDETFQKNVETHRDTVSIVVPVEQAGGEFGLTVTSQGCADAGLCYPPMQSAALVSLAGFGGVASVRVVEPSQAAPVVASQTSAIESVLHGGGFWPVVGAFFIAGLLLSLTPCVLPMLPIVSSIIVGQGADSASGVPAGGADPGSGPLRNHAAGVSRRRGLALAASYSFGMAVVYTGFGVAAGLAGEGLAAALQNPWVLGVFALGLVALSLSMFGVYTLQLPQALACRVTSAAQSLPGGRVAGVFAMGGVSALIVSPCVAAPLAGALLYLSQTRDVWLGGTALFSLAAGMSVPLLLVGASAGALLPRAGAWMVEVKAAFGVLLLGVALWTVQPVLPASAAVALWGVLGMGAATMLITRRQGPAGGRLRLSALAPAARGWRTAVAAVLAVIGAAEIAGAAAGATDPLQPLARFASGGADAARDLPRFTLVHSVAELDAALRGAGRPVMLDFYADWCVSCKEMERYTFTDPMVQKKLAGALLLKADVTGNTAEDRALLKRFRLFGPPGTIFFDLAGEEIAAARSVGFQSSARFLETLRTAGL